MFNGPVTETVLVTQHRHAERQLCLGSDRCNSSGSAALFAHRFGPRRLSFGY